MNTFRLLRVRLKYVLILLLLGVAILFWFSPTFASISVKYKEDKRREESFKSGSWFTDCVGDQSGNVKVCGEEFAILKDVSVSSDRNVHDAPSKFTLICDSLPMVSFSGISYNHLNDWYNQIQCTDKRSRAESNDKHLTIMVHRYEYANIYHSMTDFYNAFLLMKVLKETGNKTNILLWDIHAKGLLDDIWDVLFDEVVWAADRHTELVCSKLAWNIIGYNSPLNIFSLSSVPFVEEFREFFLSSYHIPTDALPNCKRLSILFIWRHDYVAHPGNPTGLIHRKILNEKEILHAAKKLFPGDLVTGVQLDDISMKLQLETIASTDILIGVHGAALTYTLFLPRHAGLIEMFPYSYGFSSSFSSAFDHFQSVAKWRQLKYLTWKNPDKDQEYQGYHTRIDPKVTNDLISDMKQKICLQ